MKTLAAVLAGCLIAGFSPAEDPWHTLDMVADKAGRIWGICIEQGKQRQPFQHSVPAFGKYDIAAEQWSFPKSGEVPEGSIPKHLAVLSDGSAVCLWASGDDTLLVTYRGGVAERWCTLKAEFHDPVLQPLSDGGLAITDRSPLVARVSADGKDPVIIPLPEQVGDNAGGAAAIRHVPPQKACAIRAVECGDGSLWLWCDVSSNPESGEPQLDGFIRWEGTSMTAMQGLPYGKQAALTEVVPEDGENFLVAVEGTGLSRLHWRDMQSKWLAKTPDFAHIETIAPAKSGLYVVTRRSYPETKFILQKQSPFNHEPDDPRFKYIPGERTGHLWHFEQGQPRKIIEGLDENPWAFARARPLLDTERGLLVGTGQDEVWWVPAKPGLKPFPVGPDQGFKARSMNKLLPVGNGCYMTGSASSACVVMALPDDIPAQPFEPASRMTSLKTRFYMVQDSRWHLWALRSRQNDLGEWDGKEWKSYELPEEVRAIEDAEFTADSHDHGWLIPKANGKTAVLDCTTGKWHVFASLEEAVEKMLVAGDKVVPWLGNDNRGVVSHPNGIKAFLASAKEPALSSAKVIIMHVLKGGKWSQISLMDLIDEHSRGAIGDASPYFDGKGGLHFYYNGHAYDLTAEGKWVKNPDESIMPPPPMRQRVLPPPGYDPRRTEWCTNYDRFGVLWIRGERGEVRKWLDHVMVEPRGSDGKPLSWSQQSSSDVLIDPSYNAWCHDLRFLPIQPVTTYQMIAAKQRRPQVQPVKLRLDAGAVALDLGEVQDGWRCWRLDGGERKMLPRQKEVLVENLPIGGHQAEIQSFDDELTPVGEAQVLTFTIQKAEDGEMARQLGRLKSNDLESREAAAVFFKRQGEAALSTLKQALAGAEGDASFQWWLKAVIQEIEGRKNLGTSKPADAQ